MRIAFLGPLALALSSSLFAQSTPPPQIQAQPAATTNPAELQDAVHLAGLPDAKPNTKGTLKLTPAALVFTSTDIDALIPFKRIISVSIGDERTERGGKTRSIASKIIPYGGGTVLAAASQKSVDLFTVEYRDPHEGYHGTVFMLPTKQAADLQQKLLARISPPEPVQAPACSAATAKPDSVLFAPIEVDGVELPAEYRILLYEQFITALRMTRPSDTYLRAGDTSAGPGCTALTLHVTVDGFKKGNQALRASTGPAGMFLGTTSLSLNVKLDGPDGKTVYDGHLKKSNRGDTDSLGLAQSVAKKISKRMDKQIKKTAA